MKQLIENRPTFNICDSSLAYSLLYHMFYKIDQHGSSSCKGTFGLLYFMGSNTIIFYCFKGVTYDALTLCYKLITFVYIDLPYILRMWSSRFHVIIVNKSHHMIFLDKRIISLCKRILYFKIYSILGFIVLFCTKFWCMFWTGIIVCQIPHSMVPSQHAVFKPNGHFLKLKLGWPTVPECPGLSRNRRCVSRVPGRSNPGQLSVME